MARFEHFKATNGLWYWRLKDGNNRIIADGGEGYSSEDSVRRAVNNVSSTVVSLYGR
ncbi:YegP family protein [Candidatus Saccharibacteria bacterium]|nr:YegP family protein [Candidatus Saccharibacteria bacterium]